MWTTTDRDIMRDIYLLLSKHPDPTRDDAYWKGLLEHGAQIYEKYDHAELAFWFVNSVFEYYSHALLEQEAKQERDRPMEPRQEVMQL